MLEFWQYVAMTQMNVLLGATAAGSLIASDLGKQGREDKLNLLAVGGATYLLFYGVFGSALYLPCLFYNAMVAWGLFALLVFVWKWKD